jgi:hypothetical protein
MDDGNEQSVAIKFCFKADLSATETLVLVQKAYGNEALNRSKVFRWYSRFRSCIYANGAYFEFKKLVSSSCVFDLKKNQYLNFWTALCKNVRERDV